MREEFAIRSDVGGKRGGLAASDPKTFIAGNRNDGHPR